jgi:UV DNA damage endonuclease
MIKNTKNKKRIKMSLQLGLCCINTELRKSNIFCSRTIIRKNFTVERAKALALLNIADIEKMCKWNFEHSIFVLRLSSDMFPHFTDTETEKYDLSFAIDALRHAGESARKYKQRITFHPGQYNQVGAQSKDVFTKTCEDLKMHADILDMMDIDKNGILCIHGGGLYDNKYETIERWIDNFQLLPENVKRRVCIENCERCYSVKDCLYIAEQCNIPLIFDSHHFDCFNLVNPDKTIEIDSVLERILSTWVERDMIPLFHISEQRKGARIGAHSDFIEKIPEYMLTIPEKYGLCIDVEVEAKMKEQAILHLYKIYPMLCKSSTKQLK